MTTSHSHESFSTDHGAIVREYPPTEVHADKRPLVMLHGIGSGADHWGALPEKIGRHIFTIDARLDDRIQTDKIKRHMAPAMRDYAIAVEDTIDDVTGDEPIDLLGLSLGGVLAQEIAIRQEKHGVKRRLAKLVLAATIPGYFTKQPQARTLAAMQAADRDPELLNTTSGVIFGGDFIANSSLAEDLGLAKGINLATNKQQLDALMAYMAAHPNQPLSLHGIMSFFNKNPISNITIPTLVMGGNPDPTTPWENSQAIHRAIPQSEIVEFENGGHLFALTRPDQTARVINRFLDKGRPSHDNN